MEVLELHCTKGFPKKGREREYLAGMDKVQTEIALPIMSSSGSLPQEGISLQELRVKLVEKELHVSALHEETRRSMEGRIEAEVRLQEHLQQVSS